MNRRLVCDQLVIASHNDGKVREIGALLAPFGVRAVSAAELGLPEPEENGCDFAENAAIKAQAAAGGARGPALADDSGLVVPALGGTPGIHSARWAGPARDFGHAMARVNEELADGADRRAHFACALALAWPDGHLEAFEGEVRGTLLWPPRGDGGFGYDPIFIPDGHEQTFGEMGAQEKDAISHRARAFAKLRAACLEG